MQKIVVNHVTKRNGGSGEENVILFAQGFLNVPAICTIFLHNVLMVLLFHYKGMLGKATMQRTLSMLLKEAAHA